MIPVISAIFSLYECIKFPYKQIIYYEKKNLY